MFRFTRKPSSGSNSQYLAKITHYTQYTLTQCTVHTPHRSQYAAITLTTSCTSCAYPLLTKCVILAKYWLWLPDDGFLVNRNMLERFYLF